MNKKITLKGISRIYPSSLSEDGECHDLLNMRIYNGALRPVLPPKVFQEVGVIKAGKHFIHTVADGRKYLIGYNHENGIIIYCPLGTDNHSEVKEITTIDTGQQVSFSSLKNILIISNKTDKTTMYAVFLGESGTYQFFDTDIFPDVIRLEFFSTWDNTKDVVSDYLVAASNNDENNAIIMGELTRLESIHLQKEGRFTGSIGIVYAWELYDGSIVRPSSPVYLSSGSWQWRFFPPDPPDTPPGFRVRVLHTTCYYAITTNEIDLFKIRDKYKHLIRGLNIYITRPLNTYNMDFHYPEEFYTNVTKDPEADVQNRVMNDPAYYLAGKIPLSQVTRSLATPYHQLFVGEYANIETLSTRQAMDVDNFSHHNLFAETNFLYNSRIFLGDIETTLYKGYSPGNFVIAPEGVRNDTPYLIYFEVEIKDGSDTKIVRSSHYDCPYYVLENGNLKPAFVLKPFFAYPDARASRLIIKLKEKLPNEKVFKVAEYGLTSHTFHNIAYAIIPDDTISLSPTSEESFLSEIKNKVIDANRVQASKVDNPLVFPAKHSYRIGNGKVIGMGANTLLVDSGQFGEFPIYVFTDSGVWAMSISGIADILIDRIVPATRDVCINANSILPTEYGIIFFSEEGVMLLTGMKTTKLSLPLEGDFISKISENPFLGDLRRLNFGVDTYHSNEEISPKKYLKTAVAGYNYIYREVIISNAQYNFSYVFSLLSNSWFRINKSYNSFVNNFPVYLSEYNNKLYDLSREDYNINTDIPVYIETSNIKLTPDSYKKINSLVIRGDFIIKDNLKLNSYLYGSCDNNIYHLLNMNSLNRSYNDIIINRSSYSVCYIVLIITGRLQKESFISHLDVSYDLRFGNKLR